MSTRSLNLRAEALRDALFYAMNPQRNVAEYRSRSRKGVWKLLTVNPMLINLSRYDYRVVTHKLWIAGDRITCKAGDLPKKVAQRILNLVSKRGDRWFTWGGVQIIPTAGGGLEVGCQKFTKADVAYARKLLK